MPRIVRPVIALAAGLLFTLAAAGGARVSNAADAGVAACRLEPFDRMLEQFIARHRVPAAAVAVTDQGRLVYARGFGRTNGEDEPAVTACSLFRIASVSKPITAAAVLQLVERGVLSLDARVANLLGWREGDTAELIADRRWFEITVRHLLQHRGGWDRDVSFDPMFRSVDFACRAGVPPPAGTDQVICCMLQERLDFSPGKRYAYSNFGYCLLGRVIEAVGGQPYPRYVQRHVLAPLGIRGMRLGRTRLEHRQLPREVRYFDPGNGPSVFAQDLGQTVPQPYGCWYLEAMDAHGGWLASAVDLARFAVAFDRPEEGSLLGPETVAEMFARPPGAAGRDAGGEPKAWYYGMGWLVRPRPDGTRNAWHNGSLPGTSAVLIRRHDGRNFVALLNTRVSEHSRRLDRELDPLLHRAADAVEVWPERDFFERDR